jgi:hypothetical protein
VKVTLALVETVLRSVNWSMIRTLTSDVDSQSALDLLDLLLFACMPRANRLRPHNAHALVLLKSVLPNKQTQPTHSGLLCRPFRQTLQVPSQEFLLSKYLAYLLINLLSQELLQTETLELLDLIPPQTLLSTLELLRTETPDSLELLQAETLERLDLIPL